MRIELDCIIAYPVNKVVNYLACEDERLLDWELFGRDDGTDRAYAGNLRDCYFGGLT